VLALAVLGINVFAYLAKGTEETASILERVFGPLLSFVGYTTLSTAKQTISTGATGAKAGVNLLAKTATTAIDSIPGADASTSQAPSSLTASGQSPSSSPIDQTALAKALNDSESHVGGGSSGGVHPDDARSSIQTTGKAGWCYIGEERGIRTCAEIGVNDTCMSGDIFPTQAVCMNPTLRA
jgi:hypothetical protein